MCDNVIRGTFRFWIGTPTDVGYNQDAVKRIVDIAVAHLKAGSVVM